MAMLIPEAWAGNPHMNDGEARVLRISRSLMEPWDGPAAIAFTDGRVIGATLDRNGLRPRATSSRTTTWWCMASETGVLPVKPEDVKHEGPPAARQDVPGRSRCEGRIVADEEIKSAALPRASPTREWLKENQITLDQLAGAAARASAPITRPSLRASAPSATPTKTCA